jgi:DNA gyrase subunit A
MVNNTVAKPAIDAMKEGAARYANYVIKNRQMADIRDGLLPVQRHVIWATWGLTKLPKRDYHKCARIVGETMGRLHPHGDSSIFGALCGMTRKHTSIALLDGDGNFGSLIDSPAAYRYCLPASERVWTNKGLVRIGDPNILGKNTIGLKKGTKIINWMNSGVHPTMKVTSKNGYSLTSTYNHPYLVLKTIKGVYTHKWVEAGDLRLGDMICTQSGYLNNTASYHKVHIGNATVLDENLAEVLGLLISDGYNNNGRFIGFGNSDRQCISRFRALWKRSVNMPLKERHVPVGKGGKTSFKSSKDYWMLECNSVQTTKQWATIGYNASNSYTVKVPDPIWTSPTPVVAAFLRGLWEGDGSGLAYLSVNESFLKEIKELLLGFFGIHTTPIYVNRGTCKAIRVYPFQAREFYDNIGQGKFIKKTLRDIPQQYTDGYRSERHIHLVPCDVEGGWSVRSKFRADYEKRVKTLQEGKNNFGNSLNAQTLYLAKHREVYERDFDYQEVVKLEAQSEQEVFDITTFDHSFTSNGFIVHNTDARLSDYGMTFVDKNYLDSVPYVNNYDGKEKVPVYLPSLLPNVLLNGVFGIGYGYKADIPAFTAKSVAKLMRKAFANSGEVSERDCHVLIPHFVNNAVCPDLTQLRPFFATGEGSMRVEPKLRIDGKDIYIEGVYSLNLEKLAEKFNDHPDVRSVSDASGKQSVSFVRVIVQCSRNMAIVAEELRAYLSDTVALRANLLINDIQPGYQHDNETLPSKLIQYSMPGLVRTWVKYRVELEKKMLNQRVGEHDDSIYKIEALLKAAAHLKDFVALLLEQIPREELVRRTSALLDCDEEQSRMVLATPTGRLAGVEIQQLEKDRKQHLTTIKALEGKIAKIYATTDDAVAETFAVLK